jgi:hypothetical protein
MATANYDLLLWALSQAHLGPPEDLAAAVRSLPDAGHLPSPWETWTLIGLVRHRERQLWVGEVVTTRLHGSLIDLARMGAMGHPQDIPQQGPVPGLPEWEYYYHGRGCCLTHRVTGESIDVDFYDDTAEYFDSWFYTNYLESLRQPEPPEQRLLALHASIRPVQLALTDLLACGILAPLPGRDIHPFRLAPAVLPHVEAIARFCEAWANPGRRLWLAALVADWPAAHEAALRGDPTLAAWTAGPAERCRELRRQRLLQALPEERFAPEALLALADLGAEELVPALKKALQGPPCGLTSTALAIISRQDDASWCPRVHALFRRLDPGGPIPQPHLWMASLKFLLRHGHSSDEMVAALPRAAGYEMGEACLLALERAPELVLPLVRRALRSDVPANRTTVAAILALIDRPWSRRELMAALEASDDQEHTADCRAALRECRDGEAQRAVQAWEERNPHEPERGTFLQIEGRVVGPFISMDEVMLRNCPEHLRYEMAQRHDRVMRVRDVVPPEPAAPHRPWWKLWGR